MTWSQASILAVVEGLTEYLPVSSTGHMILVSWLMGVNQEDFVKDYTVMVQFGAILAVVFLYWRRFVINTKTYAAVFYAFLPAAVIGLIVKKHIDILLGNVWVVASALLIGGIFLVLTDAWLRRHQHTVKSIESLPPASAVKVGFFQCLAFIPGMSRSAATIWGGLHQGMSLAMATEFSFFLAVPTLTGATFVKAIKMSVQPEQWKIVLFGNAVSFVVGMMTVRGFVHFIQRFGLKHFGVYRIVVGVAVMVALLWGKQIEFF